MNSSPPASSDWLDTLRHFADNVLGAARDRLDLLGRELEEEKFRFIRLALWFGAAAFACMMAVALLSLTLVSLCSERFRPVVLGGLTLVYAVAALVIILHLRRRLREPPPLSTAMRSFLAWGPAAAQVLRTVRRDRANGAGPGG